MSTSNKVIAFAIVSASIAVACVEKDPVVTGKRTAAAEAGAAAITVVPTPDVSDEDRADCRRCSETLSTDTARGTLCRKNGAKPSVQLLNAVVECVCYDKCIQECPSYCAGSIREDTCAPCILEKCVDPYYACLEDKVQ